MLAHKFVYENQQGLKQEHPDEELKLKTEPVGVHNPLLYTLRAKQAKMAWLGSVLPNRKTPPRVVRSMFDENDAQI